MRCPEGFAGAFDEVPGGGWYGLDCAAEHGGQALSHTLHSAAGEIFSAANMAFHIHIGLTRGADSAIAALRSRRSICPSWPIAAGPAR